MLLCASWLEGQRERGLDKIKIGVPGGKSGKMPHINSVIVADFGYFKRQGEIILGAMVAGNLQLWLVG